MLAAVTAWVVIGLVAAFVLVVVAAAARAQGRRLERRMVSELGRRWDHRTHSVPVKAPEGSAVVADAAAPDAKETPRAETDLQVTLEELLSQRDVLLEEFQAVQAQISMLKKHVERRRSMMPVADDDDDAVVQLHDVLPEEWAERRRR